MSEPITPQSDPAESPQPAAAPSDFDRARQLLAQERWAEARALYEQSLQTEGNHAGALNDLGMCHDQLGDPETAKSLYRRAIQADERMAAAYFNLGSVLEEQGHFAEADEVFQRGLKYENNSDEARGIMQRLNTRQSGTSEAEVTPEQYNHLAAVYQSINSWSFWLILSGVISIFASGIFNATWAVISILQALLAWRMRLPALLVMFGVSMAWAALTNTLAGLLGQKLQWLGFGVIQAYWACAVWRQHRAYRRLPLARMFVTNQWPAGMWKPNREEAMMGRIGVVAALSALAILVLAPLTLVSAGIVAALVEVNPIGLLSALIDLTPRLFVATLSLSAAALAATRQRRAWSIAGIVISVIGSAGTYGILMLLAMLGD